MTTNQSNEIDVAKRLTKRLLREEGITSPTDNEINDIFFTLERLDKFWFHSSAALTIAQEAVKIYKERNRS